MKGEDEDGSKDTKSKKKKDKKKVSILWLNLKPKFKKHQTVLLPGPVGCILFLLVRQKVKTSLLTASWSPRSLRFDGKLIELCNFSSF